MSIELDVREDEAGLLARAFAVEKGDLPKEAAQVFLKAKLPLTDVRRMEELGELAQRGMLTSNQCREAEVYDRVGLLLELLQSKARLSLATG